MRAFRDVRRGAARELCQGKCAFLPAAVISHSVRACVYRACSAPVFATEHGEFEKVVFELCVLRNTGIRSKSC